jgi:outer membrane protein assembly factor BamB
MNPHSRLLPGAFVPWTLGVLLVLAAPPARAGDAPVFLDAWGSCGSAPGQFTGLWGIATAPDGAVFVADEDGDRVQMFDSDGTLLLSWPVDGPIDVTVAPDGSVFVLRRQAGRVEHYTAGGAFLGAFGSTGSGDGQFIDPLGLAASAAGEIFVADTGNDRIQRFLADGTFLGKWGQGGGQAGELQLATEIAIGPGGVYVADAHNGRIHRFSETGVLLGWCYLGGPQHTPLAINYGLAADGHGHVYVISAACRSSGRSRRWRSAA